ncbi:MAG: phosphomannomutase, phosphomannomutase [Candidatus Paceibacter sp.]|jgi:phosphomannomutase|nr:phosphomannomutase, phosphomannomutase [Candidatus Paceibacter sp.]
MSTYLDAYTAFLKSHVLLKKPLTVVADPSNGTAGIVLEKLIGLPNLTLKLINNTPDGDFPAHGPNPLEKGGTDSLSIAVLEHKADFGVAFDADGDRAFFVDNTGKVLHGFQTCLLLFKNNEPPYVGDEFVYQSIKHLHLYSDKELIGSKVGTRYVKEAIKEHKASIGGELSGHYYFDKFFGLDSGIFAFVEIANLVSSMNDSLSTLLASLPPQELVNESFKTEGKNVSEILKHIEAAYEGKAEIGHRDGITLDLGTSWISIRSSNTEPILRLIAGAPTFAEAQKLVAEIKTLI